MLRGAEIQTDQASESTFRSPDLWLFFTFFWEIQVSFAPRETPFIFVLFSKTFVFKAWLAILNILLVSLLCLHLNETGLFCWFASSPRSLLVLPCIPDN